MELKVNTKKIKTITYHRNPTKEEIKFGYGCLHYFDFDIKDCLTPDGKIKKWLVRKEDGLRYYH